MSGDMKITALFSWYGSNRMLGQEVGKALTGCSWVGVPFVGGFAEIPHIKAPSIVVNDLHRAAINCAQICAHEQLGPQLYRNLRRMEFSQECLDEARRVCHGCANAPPVTDEGRMAWAGAYFVACWMNRSAKAGTDDEFKGKLPIRWTASGGDSATRFHNAVLGLPEWRRTLRRCNFDCCDFREFLAKCKDDPTCGIYCDPPFPGPGDSYVHKFDKEDHKALCLALMRFEQTKVVIRYYDTDLVRTLYDHGGTRWGWKWLEGGRTQANKEAPEVLISTDREP